MADIGRLGIAQSLKRHLDLTGTFEPSIGEGIVPTIQLADLEDTPFGLAIPWVRAATVAAVAAEYTWFVLRTGADLPANAWVSIEKVILFAGVNVEFWIEPALRSAIPTLGALGSARAARQNQEPLALIPEAEMQSGTNPVALTKNGTHINLTAQGGVVDGHWAIGSRGALVVLSDVVAITAKCSMMGHIHMTSAK